ncbi:hypothetical protein DND132_1632 [Pseudodesulfovibrio mercurii]|uniref:DUF3108 domain-containing protein n=1 Tax=Pseudodesulfovibrio mercurii TaxID=641491 RepID=F0JF38_9BACT|nr:DUF3108 domain-containing protein [Pseudodesulfovibrio mercurii]EGB14839.1 hypothetical protein DND132_1632 [Pseudodesulfovibrio mercurii]
MRGILLAALLAVLLAVPARADETPPPAFGPGERMYYDIYWTVIHAGKAELLWREDAELDGRPARYFFAKARTLGWVDNFYKVRDTMEAWTDMGLNYALLYKKDQNEGSYHKKVELVFDKEANKSYRYARGKLQHTIDQPENVFDPMSILFAFRKHALYEGMEFDANVSDGKVSVVGRAFVEGRETVETGIGDVDAFRVRLDIQHLSGVFKKSKDAQLYVWFSADERRIPVKVRSKVVVGSFIMTLREYHPPAEG